MESDLDRRLLAHFDEIELSIDEIVTWGEAETATRTRQRLLLVLDERLASLADELDDGFR